MRKTGTITINERVITINELTIRQIRGLQDSYNGDAMQTIDQLIPIITDATPEFLLDLAPSELAELYAKVKEVNSDFFTLLPLDKILAGYHETIIKTIQENLQKLSAA